MIQFVDSKRTTISEADNENSRRLLLQTTKQQQKAIDEKHKILQNDDEMLV